MQFWYPTTILKLILRRVLHAITSKICFAFFNAHFLLEKIQKEKESKEIEKAKQTTDQLRIRRQRNNPEYEGEQNAEEPKPKNEKIEADKQERKQDKQTGVHVTRRGESQRSKPDIFDNNIMVTQVSPKSPTNEKLPEMRETAKEEKVPNPENQQEK